MKKIIFPLPPLAEVERRLSIADGIERTVEKSLAQAERLCQSIEEGVREGLWRRIK